MSRKDSCMVVLSGGQDSTTCLFWAKNRFKHVHAVTFDYNQKHRIEIDAALRVAEIVGVDSHEIVSVGPILSGRSPLTNPSEQLETYSSYDQMEKVIGERVELTFVPMRNALFLTLAANKAICKDVYNLVTGVCQADNANYPDCRRSFIEAQEEAITKALGLDKDLSWFQIWTPLMDMSKKESIELAMGMEGAYVALAFTHTAYDGKYPPTGLDHASTLRAQGFRDAGVPDPLVVRAHIEGLMDLPITPNYSDQYVIVPLIESINKLKARF